VISPAAAGAMVTVTPSPVAPETMMSLMVTLLFQFVTDNGTLNVVPPVVSMEGETNEPFHPP